MRKNNYLKNHFSAFTLAEMMVVMLIMSIILAAMAPVMTTKNKTDNSSPWRYSPQNSSDAYFGAGQSMRALVGQVNGTENDNGKLVINTLNNSSISHILFKSGADNVLGDLFFSGTNLVLGNRRNSNSIIGGENINIGHDNWSTSDLTGSSNITIGDASMQSLTSGSHNIGIGTSLSAVSSGDYNIALGDNVLTSTTGNGNIAIGGEANKSSNTNATIAIGRYSSATGENSIAIGSSSEANNGNAARANAENAIAIGNTSIADRYTIAMGNNSNASDEGALALGHRTNASGFSSIALGYGPTADGHYAIAIGDSVVADSESSIAIGKSSQARATGATAIGNSSARGDSSIAIGNSSARGDSSIAIGGATAGENGIALGVASASERDSIAIGHGCSSAIRSIAMGYKTKTLSQSIIALGDLIEAAGNDSIAIGSYSEVDGENSIAIGSSSKAKGDNNTAIGYGACQYVTGSNKTCIGANSGPAYGSVYATDSNERIFIGGKSKFNGGDAVLEVHNLSTKRDGGDYDVTYTGDDCKLGTCRRSNDTTVYINGNLVVRGTTFVTSKHYGGHSFVVKALEHTSGQMQPSPKGDGWDDTCKWLPNLSDRRLKYVGKENKSGLDKIRQLKVFNYTFKKDTAKTPHVGVIAQDLQKVFPNAVKKGADGFLTIRMEDMFFAVINAIKELDSRVTKLEKENKELKARLDKLEAKVKYSHL